MVEGGMTCIKYLLFGFNFVFWITGLALIIAGAVIQAHFKEYFDVVGADFNGPAALLISVGCIIFIIGFLGCYGAVKENHCMVITFACLLSVILILELAASFAAMKMRDDVDEMVVKGLTKSLDRYANATGTAKAWDAMQRHLECCGVAKGYEDWDGKLDEGDYPKSCCKKADEAKAGCGTSPDLAYPDSCKTQVDNLIDEELVQITVAGLLVALIEVIGIIFACLLARSIRAGYESV